LTSAFTIISSVSHAVTATPYTFQPGAGVADPNPLNDPKSRLIRVWGDVNFHVRTDGGDATTSATPVAAGLSGILLSVPPGGSLSVIKMTGASDGTAWFSHVKRT
jgi:hypothetical protein